MSPACPGQMSPESELSCAKAQQKHAGTFLGRRHGSGVCWLLATRSSTLLPVHTPDSHGVMGRAVTVTGAKGGFHHCPLHREDQDSTISHYMHSDPGGPALRPVHFTRTLVTCARVGSANLELRQT